MTKQKPSCCRYSRARVHVLCISKVYACICIYIYIYAHLLACCVLRTSLGRGHLAPWIHKMKCEKKHERLCVNTHGGSCIDTKSHNIYVYIYTCMSMYIYNICMYIHVCMYVCMAVCILLEIDVIQVKYV
jgi:hypothetical protein